MKNDNSNTSINTNATIPSYDQLCCAKKKLEEQVILLKKALAKKGNAQQILEVSIEQLNTKSFNLETFEKKLILSQESSMEVMKGIFEGKVSVEETMLKTEKSIEELTEQLTALKEKIETQEQLLASLKEKHVIINQEEEAVNLKFKEEIKEQTGYLKILKGSLKIVKEECKTQQTVVNNLTKEVTVQQKIVQELIKEVTQLTNEVVKADMIVTSIDDCCLSPDTLLKNSSLEILGDIPLYEAAA